MTDDELKSYWSETNNLLRQLVNNTQPSGKLKRVVDGVVAAVTIGGAVATIDQILGWIGGLLK